MKLSGNRCECRACGLYFRSTSAFDKHRTGDYGKDRRCRTEDEMRAKGMVLNDRGIWVGSAWDRQDAP